MVKKRGPMRKAVVKKAVEKRMATLARERPGLKKRRTLRKAYKVAAKTSKPGAGKRFAAIEESAKAGGAREPAAVAASIMWKKYGKKGGAKLIKAGKRK